MRYRRKVARIPLHTYRDRYMKQFWLAFTAYTIFSSFFAGYKFLQHETNALLLFITWVVSLVVGALLFKMIFRQGTGRRK